MADMTHRGGAGGASATGTTAPMADRVRAVRSVMHDHGLEPQGFVDAFEHKAKDEWGPGNGARVVARAWVDPVFKARLLANGRATVIDELGLEMPAHHSHLVVLENTPTVQNLICCSMCSCSAFTIIGLPPDWYKDFEYRARVVRESRTVLRELGLDLPPSVEIRVWDTTADTRYLVLPERPAGTEGWSEERLAALVTRDSLIGAARLASPAIA